MPLKTYQDPLPELNLTSMIDVVFLLLIFFMVGTKFAEMEKTVAIDLPKVPAAQSLTASAGHCVVHVHQDGSIGMDQRTLTLPELRQEISIRAQQSPGLKVVVRGDRNGAFQHVASVLTACREAGARGLGIGVDEEAPRTR